MAQVNRSRVFRVLVLLALLVQSAGAATQPALAGTSSSTEDEVYDWLEDLAAAEIAVLDDWWTPMFVNNGWREPEVSYLLLRPDDAVEMACVDEDGDPVTVRGDERNAYYCDQDRTVIDGVRYSGAIYIPIMPFVDLYTTGEFWGLGEVDTPEYIPMAVIAHEFSHHVVAEIYHQAREDRGWALTMPTVPNNELIADCLAGAFMLAYSRVAELTYRDIDGILNGLALIADPETSEVSHGTPSQRTKAFTTGFYALDPDADTVSFCYADYWPALLDAFEGRSQNGEAWVPSAGDQVQVTSGETPLWDTLESDSEMVGTLPYGMIVTVTGTVEYDAAGEAWVPVRTPDDYWGWVNLGNLSPVS